MLAGPMDYTPGGFHNATREQFEPRNSQPMVMGTRAHALALYAVFESGLQMVSDYPELQRPAGIRIREGCAGHLGRDPRGGRPARRLYYGGPPSRP